MNRFQAQTPTKRNEWGRPVRLLGGLVLPGLGQLLAGRWVAALVVHVAVLTLVAWAALLGNQLVIDRLYMGRNLPWPSVLSGRFLSELRAAGGMPPELGVLLFMAVAIHVGAAVTAGRDARLSSPARPLDGPPHAPE